MKHIRHIRMRHAFNLRDMGGILNEEGKMTKWNMLYRSDSVEALERDEWEFLYQMGIRTIIDLRSTHEQKHHPYECEIYGIKHICLPMQKEANRKSGSIDELAKASYLFSLSQSYPHMILDNPNGIAQIIDEVIFHLQKGAVLFHCSAGRDRSGVLAALILFILRVNKADILADYQVSYIYNTKGVLYKHDEVLKDKGACDFIRARPENLLPLLDFLQQEEGQRLLKTFVTKMKYESLCSLMLE